MRSTYKQFYYINRGRVKADGTTSIFCRITIDGKVSAIATGLYCAPEEWDTKKGEAKNARVNGQLQAFRLRIDEAYEQATKEKGIVTAEILKNVIVDANTIPMTLPLARRSVNALGCALSVLTQHLLIANLRHRS